jgi:hypothetical protein
VTPDDRAHIACSYSRIRDDVYNEYALGYTSNDPERDGSFRRIMVRVDEPNVRARTRSGYQVERTRVTRR